MKLHPQNLGNAVAHDYIINVKFPTGSQIKSIENEWFDIIEGGIGEAFVKFLKEAFPPGIIYPPIHIDAERKGETVLPREVSVTCREQKTKISLPSLSGE